jgi:hypothetical protein
MATRVGPRSGWIARTWGNPTAGNDVDLALGNALTQAAAAGRFDVVAQLAKELEARRLTRLGNVVTLPGRPLRRGE